MQDSNEKRFALYDINGAVREDLVADPDLQQIFADVENSPTELLD
jgi:hypothetical protein